MRCRIITPTIVANREAANKPAMTDLADFDYELPPELIAQQPLANRPDSRLMVVDRGSGSIDHWHFRDLPNFLNAGDALVLNDTRVVPAKLVGYRETTGGRWQGLFLDSDEQGSWKLLCKTRGKLFEGERIGLVDRQGRAAVWLRLVMKVDGGMWIAKPESEEPTFDVLQQIGRIPLPHYIRKGEAVTADSQDYQTVFATHPGSVAAPTAGLHFNENLLKEIAEKGVKICKVTLHVGVGTFRPIKVEKLEDHQMHSEWCEVTDETAAELNGIRSAGGRVIAIGTTSVRTLESASQSGTLTAWNAPTDLFIRPGYQFRSVDSLVTNFHLPKSTLLVLVQTFGEAALLKRAYQEAVAEEYRFFSYGDAMLIV